MDLSDLTGQPDADLPIAPMIAMPAEPVDQRNPESPELSQDDLLGRLSLCRFCSEYHPSFCPYIQKISWHESGILASVELKDRVADLKDRTFASFKEMQEALEAKDVHIEPVTNGEE